MTDRPDLSEVGNTAIIRSDPLSAVLRLVRTRGELICRSQFGAPFGVAFPSGPVHFHALEAGSLWVRSTLAEKPFRVNAGAFLLFPHGDGHSLSSAREGTMTPLPEIVANRTDVDRANHRLRFGGDGDCAELTCLRFAYENPLALRWLETLPRVIVVSARREDEAFSIGATVRAMMRESERPGPGSAILVSQLIDLLFIQMMRIWVAEHPTETGWLTGAADVRVGRALAAVHGSPAQAWTVTELANSAGLSRSTFNARFTSLVGVAPITYLLEWRMKLAADRLRATREPVGKIAFDLGYGSEAGFSRAFKARFGEAPSRFRARAD